jgi:hypothetical protein
MTGSTLRLATALFLLTGSTSLIVAAAPAAAQTEAPVVPVPQVPLRLIDPTPGFLERGQTVVERPRPELDPLGLRLGQFFFFPRGEVAEAYDDNVFATKSAPRSDFITILRPSVDVISNFARHAVNLRAAAEVGRYADHVSENYTDYYTSVDGRYDLTRAVALFGSGKWERLHEGRDDPNAIGGTAEPPVYDQFTGTVGVAQRGLRIGYAADFTIRRLQYDTVKAIGGGIIDESARDVNIYEGSARGSYEILKGYSAFVRGTVNKREYDNSQAGNPLAPKRDSSGYRMDVGTTIDLGGVTYGEFFIGYLSQDYEDPAFNTIDGVAYGANVYWNVTQLTTVRFTASRDVIDSVDFAEGRNSAGFLSSTVAVQADHELLRNLLVSGRLRYVNDDFQGIDRNDDRYEFRAGAKYSFNRNLYVGGDYTFAHRESTGTNKINSFDRDIVMLRVGTQF